MRKRRGWVLGRAALVLAAGFAVGAMLTAALSGFAHAADESSTPAARPSVPAAPPPSPPETMKVVPADENAGGAPAAKKRKVHPAVEVEPAAARLKTREDAWIFTGPSKWTKHVIRARAGKYVVVTGATRYYLRVKLKSGATGYIAAAAVELVTPTDKIFQLTADAPVLAKPNRWAEKVAEVHKGHAVHAIGVALSYMRIRMKSGLAGFIPVTALQ